MSSFNSGHCTVLLPLLWPCDLSFAPPPPRARQTYWNMPEVKSRRTSSRSTMLHSPVTWVKVEQRVAPLAQSLRADAALRPFLKRPLLRRSLLMRTTKDPQCCCAGALLVPASWPLACFCLPLLSLSFSYPGILTRHTFHRVHSCTRSTAVTSHGRLPFNHQQNATTAQSHKICNKFSEDF